MTDKDFLISLSKVEDPKEALRILVENENLLGFDPYYGELRRALLNMCERLSVTKTI